VKAWNPKMASNMAQIEYLPIWMQLPRLAIKYWSMDCFSKLDNLIVIPMTTDKHTYDKSMLQ